MTDLVSSILEIYQQVTFFDGKNFEITMINVPVFFIGFMFFFMSAVAMEKNPNAGNVFGVIFILLVIGGISLWFYGNSYDDKEKESRVALEKELDILKNSIVKKEFPVETTTIHKVIDFSSVDSKACFAHYNKTEDAENEDNCLLATVLSEDKKVQNIFIPSSLVEGDMSNNSLQLEYYSFSKGFREMMSEEYGINSENIPNLNSKNWVIGVKIK